jgi:hypothetical protein
VFKFALIVEVQVEAVAGRGLQSGKEMLLAARRGEYKSARAWRRFAINQEAMK